MLLYAAALYLLLARRHPSLARALWTAACALLFIHVALAFHFTHHWSHAHALHETARQTQDLTGWSTGIGVYLNYLTLLLWSADTTWWWQAGHPRYQARPRGYTPIIHAYLLFMAMNATIVFARGPTRYVAAAALLAIAIRAAVTAAKEAARAPRP
jgi:hypothetical protein